MANNEVIVNFNANGASGTQAQLRGDTSKGRIILKAPKCTFTPPLNKAFKTWSRAANDEKVTFNEGADLAFSSGITLELFAIWQEAQNNGTGNDNQNKPSIPSTPPLDDALADLLKPENKDKFFARILELLSKNNAWLEQVKMTLFAVYHLELAFHSLNKQYEFSLSECMRILEEIKALQAEYKIYLEHLIQGFDTDYTAKLAALELNFAQKQKIIDEAGKLAEKVVKIHEELLELSDSVKTDLENIEEIATEIKALQQSIKDTKIDEKLALLEERFKEFNKLSEEFQKLLASKDEILKEIATKSAEFKTTTDGIINHLNQLETDIDFKKNEAVEQITKQATAEVEKARDEAIKQVGQAGTNEAKVNELIAAKTGDLATLGTTDKSNLVAAINEVRQNATQSTNLNNLINTTNTNLNNLTKLHKFEPVRINTNPAVIDFTQGNCFIIDASVTKTINVGNVNGKIGSSGVICVYNCQNLQSFDGKFKWRTTQANFSGSEVFAYWIHDANWIRIARS